MNIAKLRKRAGYTQKDLAKLLNVDQSAVSKWESGAAKPLKKLHEPLARALGCTVEELRAEE